MFFEIAKKVTQNFDFFKIPQKQPNLETDQGQNNVNNELTDGFTGAPPGDPQLRKDEWRRTGDVRHDDDDGLLHGSDLGP